ncbi:unnamed protein product [Psylliodes chrysocephalus]|uniref:DUF7869 domain-containing protein n=1 Tax=Psylliodes chrysocephalus TaxID=3402493 RepID=A0A9P0D7H5_9CUCU|nr:unnamed protein product [Psylliodes chrysocephala]
MSIKKLRCKDEIGGECYCKHLQCSRKIPVEGKQNIIRSFNLLESTNTQNSHLCGLISIVPVKNRRPRLDEANARLRDVVAFYKIRYLYENNFTELEVCRDEFIALHGITRRRIEYLLTSLKSTGMPPTDKRGKLSDDTRNKMKEHISSFKGRGSHYSTKDSQKKYLPEELNIKKMWKCFKRHLDLFCDSCGGQNKNYTFFRYLHNLVHQQKRFNSVRVTFPIRGHSYMENDKNMGIINQKARVENVKELCDLIQCSRKKPSLFVMEHISEDNQHIFKKWTKHE